VPVHLKRNGETSGSCHNRQVSLSVQLSSSSLTAAPSRHGARIDAADKEWHLTSPAPYDPPLTYGGWTQGRALGARIASLLQAREEAVHDHTSVASSSSGSGSSTATEATTLNQNPRPRRIRKHKVVIHSSPYLRCIQSAIAIGAGMSQYHRASNDQASRDASLMTPNTDSEDVSPATSPAMTPADNSLQPATDKEKHNHHATHHRTFPRARLRIDAFLGEWLSPDYYDQITPPPGSVMMVASAKAELLRRGEGIQRAHDPGSTPLSGHFPGGWRSASNPSTPDTDDDAGRFRSLSSIANALPQLGRSGSPDSPLGRSGKLITIRDVLSRGHSHSNEGFSDGYVPPVPSYAISPSDSIPAGYVAHARDACVDVDYQWDSMRDPPNWGDGGEYGEEWSTMHLRFRNGLMAMLDWYRRQHPYHHNHHHHHHHHHNHHDDHESEDEHADTVLVLITHGAGCNALIGALTNQPVLLDVAMASLTMAVRKDIIKGKDGGQSVAEVEEQRLPSPVEPSISQEYEMSLIASTEHLQAGSNPLSIPQLHSPTMPIIPSRPSIPTYRHRFDAPAPRFHADAMNTPSSLSFGLQRSATTNSSHSYSRRHTAAAAGLWVNAPAAPSESVVETPVESGRERGDITPSSKEHFSAPASGSSMTNRLDSGSAELHAAAAAAATTASTTEHEEPQPKAQRGLWSSAIIAQELEEPVTKRRWTVTERHR
jgi:hypothetical protein